MEDAGKITIRPFEQADWARLCEIHDAARQDELALSVGMEAFLSLEQTYENEGLFEGQVAVAEIAGTVCGFVAFSDHELTWLYVDPACYRRGVGRALVRHAKAMARPGMTIEMLEGNLPAIALYQAEGFVPVERKTGQLIGNEAFAAQGVVLRHNDGTA
ncbi:GNAT family N-acetyltransferase [Gymnodinialimonas sp. 2305UL16-5]|uniref:GNAT family N-acetyltransferase n=1 Tax=Gymnodinialimonas mytili TaxID=3126503 RepID=UPI0030AC0DFF